ncbi:uncharacterized protein LOC129802544 [Phlebotomus papatasi]|uniref:uncharacterized protein LOC129802544 n=1 Tax=Phlebotomus papatasi TaxID=29031 RepID=UPI002483586F|nr:uncharacterized protein LOC129802544 [Phlebotomus papatasi]
MVQTVQALDQEFQEFFRKLDEQNLSQKDYQKICRPLIVHLRMKLLKKYFFIALLLVILWSISQVSVVNWNLVAIGRIILIKLLPFWNWTHLHDAKCLLDYPLASNTDDHVVSEKPALDCSVCENIDSIQTTWNTDYTFINEEFLERGLPVILINSHPPWPEDNFTQHLLTLEPLMESSPCEMSSNLIVRRLANLHELIERVQKVDEQSWFIHFRNCDFPAVKASRLIASRPGFFSPHLEPAYSSWVLMSRNYDYPAPKELTLEGIVLVRQLLGRGVFKLSGRGKCLEECGKYIVNVKSGEALLFTTDLWDFSYYTSESSIKSVTFITETHFEL